MKWIVTSNNILINLDMVQQICLSADGLDVEFIFDDSEDYINKVFEEFHEFEKADKALDGYIKMLV